MKRKKAAALAVTLLLVLSLAGCSSDTAGSTGDTTDTAGTEDGSTSDAGAGSESSAAVQTTHSEEEMFTDRDKEIGYDETECTIIALSGSGASCTDTTVQIEGTVVTITAEGTYLIRGELDDGMILIDAADTDKIQLVLDGADITNETGAALYIRNADKVFVTLAADSENMLANGGSYEAIDDNNVDAVIFSRSDLTLNGTGVLTITAEAGHGIVSKDDLVFTSGTYTITAASHGLVGKDSVRIADGTFVITAGKDGIHSENADDETLGFVYLSGGSYTITSGGDGISAQSTLELLDGTCEITAGGGSAAYVDDHQSDWGAMFRNQMNNGQTPDDTAADSTAADSTAAEDTSVSTKGIKSGGALTITDGTYVVDSADDALHCGGDLTIGGGTFTLSTGDDGMHADAALVILDGTVEILKSYEGLEGLTVEISGGDIRLTASDDGINAAGGNDQSGVGGRMSSFNGDDSYSILISGGTLYVDAGGDGLDSNGSLTVTGGEVWIDGPENSGNGALDYGTEATISGGTVVALGASGMAVNFGSNSTQGAMLVTVDNQSAGTAVELADVDGNTLVSGTSGKSYSSVLISTPGIIDGGTYTLTAGTSEQELTMDGLIYGSSSGFGGGGGGGFDGGNGGGRMNGGNRMDNSGEGEMMQNGDRPQRTWPDGAGPDGAAPDGAAPEAL